MNYISSSFPPVRPEWFVSGRLTPQSVAREGTAFQGRGQIPRCARNDKGAMKMITGAVGVRKRAAGDQMVAPTGKSKGMGQGKSKGRRDDGR